MGWCDLVLEDLGELLDLPGMDGALPDGCVHGDLLEGRSEAENPPFQAQTVVKNNKTRSTTDRVHQKGRRANSCMDPVTMLPVMRIVHLLHLVYHRSPEYRN
jgi:hypothetical protein